MSKTLLVLAATSTGRLNFFRSIVTFSRGSRPEFALRRPLESSTGSFGEAFHVGREFLLLAFLREVRRGRRRRPQTILAVMTDRDCTQTSPPTSRN